MTVTKKTWNIEEAILYIDRVNDALCQLEMRLIKLESLHDTLELRTKKQERNNDRR